VIHYTRATASQRRVPSEGIGPMFLLERAAPPDRTGALGGQLR
jgi:hypothetical protein